MRINGFTRPANKYQIISRVVFLLTNGVLFALFVPNLAEIRLKVVFGAYCLTLCLVVTSGLSASFIDPTDRAVKHTRQPNRYSLDSDILSYPKYCVLCRSRTEKRSKHCRKCNRCTSHFDHHCVWLNNCIGKDNYPWFFLLVSSLEVLTVLQLYCGVDAMRLMFTPDPSPSLFHTYDLGDHGYFFFSLISVSTTIALTVAISNGFLLFFHVYISVKHVTTFEYLQYAQKRKAKVHPRIVNLNASTRSATSQIVPQADTTYGGQNACGDTTKDECSPGKGKSTISQDAKGEGREAGDKDNTD